MFRTFDREPVPDVPDDRTDVTQFANALSKVTSVDLFFIQTMEKWLRNGLPSDVLPLLECIIRKLRSSVTWESLEVEKCGPDNHRIVITGRTGKFVSTPLVNCQVCVLFSVFVTLGCKVKILRGVQQIEALTKTQWRRKLQLFSESSRDVSSLKQLSLDVVCPRLQPGVSEQMLWDEVGMPSVLSQDVRKVDKVEAIKRDIQMYFDHFGDRCDMCEIEEMWWKK